MNGVNMAILLGNIGRDPETRQTQSGMTVLKFSLATNGRRKQSGEWIDAVEWHNIVVFGNRAEGLARFIGKGMTVHVVGEIRTNKYEDRDGNTRYMTQIIANEVSVVGSRQDRQQDPYVPPTTTGAPKHSERYYDADAQPKTPFDDEEEIPF